MATTVDYKSLPPVELRKMIRSGEYSAPTSGCCSGFLQANLVILHKDLAPKFQEFCDANRGPCPILAMLEPGQRNPVNLVAENVVADVATDLPRYLVYRKGQEKPEKRTKVDDIWNENMVAFFLGCSFGFEKALENAGIPLRNIQENKNVSMYITNRRCTPVPPFDTNLVVSYRPVPKDRVDDAIKITGELKNAHGPPIHCGDPAELGIADLSKVSFGDAVTKYEGEVPCFWPCGVTAVLAALSADSDLVITHDPGHMFVTDLLANVNKV